jgi:CheY-like chemotaxis protein
VFANRLGNAAKYTDPGGHIAVTVAPDGHEAVVTVRDDGIGIDAPQLARIFDMFAQLTPAIERSRGGLGIGLSLVRGLVALHGGRVEAASAGPGRGSEFRVHLPLMPAADDAQAPPALLRGHDGATHPAPHRVLVVDDNADAARTRSAVFEQHGHAVRPAFGGLQALELAEAWRPDVAVVDIGMPDLNGYEVGRRIRAQPWGEHMVLIACTGWGQAEDRRRASAAGFDHHVVKPVEPNTVLALVAGSPGAGH